jgi:hypothetical protein
MKILAGCVLLAGLLMPQQSSSEYHLLYGDSDIERFQVRPGITLTVEYGSDHLACQMVIAALRPIAYSMEQSKLLSQIDVDEILNEVDPPATRGAKIHGLGGFQSSAAYESKVEYENATISIVGTSCKNSSSDQCGVAGASVALKRKACEILTK